MKLFGIIGAAGLSILAADVRAATTFNTLTGAAPVIIGHRGSTGYMPEHTLGGYELAVDLGADYVEPDLQMTSDGQLVCMHDTTLDRTTNVSSLYAKRNGHTTYNVGDFTLAEIQGLTVHADTSANPLASQTGYLNSSDPTFSPQFSNPANEFTVPSFADVLNFVKSERAIGHNIGVYPEAKQGDTAMETQIVNGLKTAGLTKMSDNVIIQSFDSSILKDLHTNMASFGLDVPLMQLDSSPTSGELKAFSAYAQIVGPDVTSANVNAAYMATAHADGMAVHGYTFTDPTASTAIPAYEKYFNIGIDGVFSNYADLAVDARAALVPEPASLALLGGLAFVTLRRKRNA